MSRFHRILLLSIILISFFLVSSLLPPSDTSHPTLANNTCLQSLPQCANTSARLLFISMLSTLFIWSILSIVKHTNTQTLTYIRNAPHIPSPPLQSALSRGRLCSRHYL